MLNAGLLVRMRDDTNRFIAVAPVEIELDTFTVEDDGTGGKRTISSGTRPPQVFTLLEPRSSGYGEKLTMPEGTNSKFDFMLLGVWDAMIGMKDQFVMDGLVYRVENILPNNGYETRAMVLRTGEVA